MKKNLLLIYAMLLCVASFAQTATNADGSLRFRGNVAIFVTHKTYVFEKGSFKRQVDDQLDVAEKELDGAMYALAMQKFGNSGWGVVNRDNELAAKVKSQLEEQKLEDYIEGFAVHAKGEGADCIFICDRTLYQEENVVQMFYACRLIDLTTNKGLHFSMKSDPIVATDMLGMQKQIRKMIEDYQTFLYQSILEYDPAQFVIMKSDGKKLYLGSVSSSGRVLESDKFYAFKFSKESLKANERSVDVSVLSKLAESTSKPVGESGYLVIKTDKTIEASNDVILFKDQSEPTSVSMTNTLAYFPLTYSPDTYDGFIKTRVNNAAYDALTKHPGSTIIEQEFLPELKKERELQKTEDFIDGHVVEQMKAIGAQYILHLDNFSMNGKQVSFKLNLVSIEQNRIIRSVDVVSSIDNIENEMYKQLCERMIHPCNIKTINKEKISVLSGWALKEGTKFIISINKQIQNPITGETSYTSVDVCKCSVTQYMGCRFGAKIDKIISPEDYAALDQYADNGSASIRLDGSDIKSDTSTQSEVEKTVKKQERKEKAKSLLKALGSAINIQVQ
ncbi:MAG: hypothetical protein J1E58_03325 [Prevotella sp.]|nr:hypothetical protein [Prevotella sp.]